MALFGRRNKDGTQPTEVQVPAEIQEYYQAERRERAGVAWLLALATLAVTLLVAVGLFFGGRWVYRKATHKNVATTKTSQPATTESAPANSSSPSSTSDQSSSTSTSSNSSSTTPTSPTSSNSSSSTSSTTTSTPSASQSTAASNTSLPNTGPGDILKVFVIVTLVGALAHNLLSRYQTSRSQ